MILLKKNVREIRYSIAYERQKERLDTRPKLGETHRSQIGEKLESIKAEGDGNGRKRVLDPRADFPK